MIQNNRDFGPLRRGQITPSVGEFREGHEKLRLSLDKRLYRAIFEQLFGLKVRRASDRTETLLTTDPSS